MPSLKTDTMLLPQANCLFFCFAGLRMLSDHTLQSNSQDWHPFLWLAHCSVPTAEVPPGGVCEGQPARGGPLPRRGNLVPTASFCLCFSLYPESEPRRGQMQDVVVLLRKEGRTRRPHASSVLYGKRLVLVPSIYSHFWYQFLHHFFGDKFKWLQNKGD